MPIKRRRGRSGDEENSDRADFAAFTIKSAYSDQAYRRTMLNRSLSPRLLWTLCVAACAWGQFVLAGDGDYPTPRRPGKVKVDTVAPQPAPTVPAPLAPAPLPAAPQVLQPLNAVTPKPAQTASQATLLPPRTAWGVVVPAVEMEPQSPAAASTANRIPSEFPTPRPLGHRPPLRQVADTRELDLVAPSPSDAAPELRTARQPEPAPIPGAAPAEPAPPSELQPKLEPIPNLQPPMPTPAAPSEAEPPSPITSSPFEIVCPSGEQMRFWFKPFRSIVATAAPRKLNDSFDRNLTAEWTPFVGPLPIDCSQYLFEEPRPAAASLGWPEYEFNWVAPEYWHHPVYFDDVPLERYGQSLVPRRQSWLSGLKFYTGFAVMPAKLWADRPFSYISSLGKYRPGSPAPAIKQRPRWPWDDEWLGLTKGVWAFNTYWYPGPRLDYCDPYE